MDADEEKLTALKKAYADIILGISKEAAARVMVSDKKSGLYQHEIKVAKEEGLRMLLRLKQMMDSKTSEAEAASLNQQNKIEELEAQLQEAEDIVKDLREELVEVRVELERVKNEKSQHVNDPENAWSRDFQVENVNYSYQSPNESSVPYDVNLPYLSHRNRCHKCYNKTVCTCGADIGNRGLPSIILRGKEMGLYRNGCTQRIRACERNLSDKELSLTEEKDKTTLKSPTCGADNELEKKLLEDISLSSSQSFVLKRKRANRRRKTVIPLGPALSHDKVEPQIQTGFAESCEKERNIQETGLGESLLSPECKMDVEKIDTPSNILDANLSDIIKRFPSQRVNEKAVKYTFERKRKRQALSRSNVNGSLETEKKTGDEQNCDQKPEQSKCSPSMESSRDSRRLAQVARQLLSLSEKKWWN
ncbi:hypothetical protein BUALT_Bualt02G0146200 [Buddleja alternifolia]|uniref:Uncharacterized protein n=1 Tax=Buddleja alternifolia TaxID=168488 RepID=A0AAV6Y1T3_9LAMI|nr:hypothetical protein BUALT_Bualt02G0146200 [Buddleja alternifolia]